MRNDTTQDTAVRPARDRTYFMRRAAQERSAADHAIGAEAREAHAELAKRYRHLVKAGATETMSSSRT